MTSIVGVLAAAGAGTRFGAHKLLSELPDGTSVGSAAAQNLIAAIPNCVAVVRPGDRDLAHQFEAIGLEVVINGRSHAGLGTSIACGVAARPHAAGWVIALADMPAVQPETTLSVIRALRAGTGIAAPVFRGQRGHPVGFPRVFYGALVRLTGDCGARTILAAHPARVRLVPVHDPGVVYDIDYRTDLHRCAGAGTPRVEL